MSNLGCQLRTNRPNLFGLRTRRFVSSSAEETFFFLSLLQSVDQSVMECLCWGNGDSYIAAGTKKGNVFLYNQLTKQTFAAFTQKQTSKVNISLSSLAERSSRRGEIA